MRAKLISREHGEFTFAKEATIGRSADSTICLEASVVSTEHARITLDPDSLRYVLEDLGSLNGTRLDGMRIDRPEPLGSLHLISFGGSEDFIFQALSIEEIGEPDTIEIPPVRKTRPGDEALVLPQALRDEAAGAQTPQEKRPAKNKKAAAEKKPVVEGHQPSAEPDAGDTRIEEDLVPVPEVLAAASSAPAEAAGAGESATGSRWILEFTLEGESKRFVLAEGENLVGRSKEARIQLDFPDLSRRHAVLTVGEGKIFVRDEGSRNHTFVGGTKVDGKVVVPAGAQILFCRLEARVIEES